MTKKLLIVEDDPFTQQFYDYLFSKTDYEIIQTEDGDEIRRVLENEEIALVILDINLKNTSWDGKKVDGVNISKFLKDSEDTAEIPILLVTAYQKKVGNNNLFLNSKADDYIIKPITDFNALLDKINKLVGK